MTAAVHQAPSSPVSEHGQPSLAVVIPTYGREQVLADTLELVLRQEPPADEVLVIDQTPEHEPGTAEFLERHAAAGAIRWIRQSPPNLPAARNRGLRETTCEVVLFLDDDVIPEPGLIGFHRSNYSSPSVEAVTGRLIGRPVRRDRPAKPPHAPHLEFRDFDFDSTRRRERVAVLCGGNHSVRPSTALALGGYDENYLGWAFREETDLALRLHRAGNRIVFDPRAALLHLAAPSGGCRHAGFRRMLQQWKVSFPAHYFGWKHLFPGPCFWQELAVDLRRSVFSRHNVLGPWRVPMAAASFAFSFVYSWFRWQRCK